MGFEADDPKTGFALAVQDFKDELAESEVKSKIRLNE